MTSPHKKISHQLVVPDLEVLCSLVHGNLDRGNDMREEAKEIKQLIQAANQHLGRDSLIGSRSWRNRVGQLLDKFSRN